MAARLTARPHTRHSKRLFRFVPWLTVATAALTGFVLLSRTLHTNYQTSWESLFVMKSSTAWLLFLAAVTLFLRWSNSRIAQRASVACALVIIIIGSLMLADALLDTHIGADRLLLPAAQPPSLPGPPAAVTSLCLMAIALASILVAGRQVLYSQLLFFIATAIPLVRLGGYLFHAPGVTPRESLALTAIYTAACELALCFAGMCLRPDGGMMKVVASESIAGASARRLLPLAFSVPVLIGYLVLIGERNETFGVDLGFALVVAVCALSFASIVWLIMTLLWNGELVRAQVERRLRATETRALAGKRREEERIAFLSALADELRDLSDPRLIMETAARSIRAAFAAGRAGFGSIDADRDEVTIEAESADADVPSAVGTHSLQALAKVPLDAIRAGQVARIEDRIPPRNFASTPAQLDTPDRGTSTAYDLSDARAGLWIPLLPTGSGLAFMYVLNEGARSWTDEEVEVAAGASQRAWSALERARAAVALAESERRFRLLADAAPVLIGIFDAAGKSQWFNRTWLEFTGRGLAQELDAGLATNLHPEERRRCLRIVLASFRQRRSFNIDCRSRRRDGEYRWLVTSAVPLYEGQHNAFSGFVCSCTDITDMKDAQSTLQEADRRKDEFLATLAHELRNPLAPIRQAARVARAKEATTAQFEWGLDVIDRQVAHMGLLLDDLLDVSRITRGQLTLRKMRVSLRSVIDDAIEIARPLIDSKRHSLHVDMPAGETQVVVDPLRLSQVVGNLLINAAKYSDRNAAIALRAEAGEALVVSVRDSGIGIESDMLARVFSMFSQAKTALDRSDGGLGIGLALVKGLVELHGGTVQARSAGLGRGSEFVLRMPYEAEVSAPEPQPAAAISRTDDPQPSGAGPAPEMRPGRRRVLIADDNRDAAESLNMLLDLEGYAVKVAHDGREAVDMAEEFNPDIVLLDVGMPKLNGYEAARELRSRPWSQATTMIAITGWGQPEDRARAREAGFDHHMTKPVDLDTLLSVLKAPSP